MSPSFVVFLLAVAFGLLGLLGLLFDWLYYPEFFGMAVFFLIASLFVGVIEGVSPEYLQSSYDELVENIEQNPFNDEYIVKAIELNAKIDKANITGKGDYYGFEPIDYEAIREKFIVDNYADAIADKILQKMDYASQKAKEIHPG